MKVYLCHKRVRAAQIIAVEHMTRVHSVLHLDDGDKISIEEGKGLAARYMPVMGDYLVEYPPDGYRSISPRKAFEDGYSCLDQG